MSGFGAASALGAKGDREAVPHLIRDLDATTGRVLLKVGRALGRLGGVSELFHALRSKEWRVREAAVIGLGEAGWKAVPFLFRALNDELQEVRKQAAAALRRLGIPAPTRRGRRD